MKRPEIIESDHNDFSWGVRYRDVPDNQLEIRRRINILDILIDKIDLAGTMERIESFIQSGRRHQIVTANLDFITIALREPAFKELINSADLVVPDGMPVVWASRFLGNPLTERVTGVELVYHCSEMAAQKNYSVFLLGGEPGVAVEASKVLCETYEGLKIAGTYSPSFGVWSQQEEEEMVQIIKESAPEFLFVGLGCPKQDYWIQRHKQELGVPVSIGTGCTFDLLAGHSKRAPYWMQNSGLEWLFRLGQEPGRLWKRYLMDLPTLFKIFAWRFQTNGTRTSDSEA